VDRHIFAKRIRVWVNADGFISPLDLKNLSSFEPGPPAIWRFIANAGDGRSVGIEIKADMLEGRNTTVFHFLRPSAIQPMEKPLPPEADVRLTVRVDIEDRNFHSQTQRNGGADFHFASNIHPLQTENSKLKTQNPAGFAFTPAPDRQLRVIASEGAYHSSLEWSENIPHPIEQSRGQIGAGDAFSPGWFELPLSLGANLNLIITADPIVPKHSQTENFKLEIEHEEIGFESQLFRAAEAFVVRRGDGKTVIAGYPWFLDWGRDTFICARGLLAAGMIEEVKQILLTFARFEKNGTLPNTIFGEDASNRDTSDAPLWFGLVCEELEKISPSAGENRGSIYKKIVDDFGRTLLDVLRSIATNYIAGTPNGIRMDVDSALIWSPSHFTWMDTNYPAASAREGYPIEIQALWIRFLQQLANLDQGAERSRWEELAARATASFEKFFWLEEKGFYADALFAQSGQPASASIASDALRPNCLIAVSLGIAKGNRARRCVEAAARYLIIPGAVRSLAPLPGSVPLPVYGSHGELLNNPHEPYRDRYIGDEDTSRKPAYHTGTAWTWLLPVFCEALARVWNFSPEAVAVSRAYLGGMDRVINTGCLGQLPEVLDGDAPHTERGCDAQAWSATEALRVWKLLQEYSPVSQ
jgi:predicted glycogen debranching enzyme